MAAQMNQDRGPHIYMEGSGMWRPDELTGGTPVPRDQGGSGPFMFAATKEVGLGNPTCTRSMNGAQYA
jgi:hypothetical protein